VRSSMIDQNFQLNTKECTRIKHKCAIFLKISLYRILNKSVIVFETSLGIPVSVPFANKSFSVAAIASQKTNTSDTFACAASRDHNDRDNDNITVC